MPVDVEPDLVRQHDPAKFADYLPSGIRFGCKHRQRQVKSSLLDQGCRDSDHEVEQIPICYDDEARR